MSSRFFEKCKVGEVVDRVIALRLPVGSQIRRVDGFNPPYRTLTMYEPTLYDSGAIGSGKWEIMRIGWGTRTNRSTAPSDQGSCPEPMAYGPMAQE